MATLQKTIEHMEARIVELEAGKATFTAHKRKSSVKSKHSAVLEDYISPAKEDGKRPEL